MRERRVIGDRVQDVPRKEIDQAPSGAVMVGGVLTDCRAPLREFTKPGNELLQPASLRSAIPERYPIPIKITDVGGQDEEGNDLYDVVELNGIGVSLGITHDDVPNVGRPAATLEVDHQTKMGYSAESDSFFFGEAT